MGTFDDLEGCGPEPAILWDDPDIIVGRDAEGHFYWGVGKSNYWEGLVMHFNKLHFAWHRRLWRWAMGLWRRGR